MKILDKAALRKKYLEERDKRLRPDAEEQYVRLSAVSEAADLDPFMSVEPRDPVADHVTVTILGGGFAGLTTGARMSQRGITDVRIVEKAGDFGGVWYWNRYPGIMCDSAAMIYLPLLEETGYMPTEKYAHGPEIRDYCSLIARKFNLYDKALLHTKVTRLAWDSGANVWNVETNRGDKFTSNFVVMGPGPLTVPKIPRIPGLDEFKGKFFHSSRWDYGYTGGTPDGSAYRSGVGSAWNDEGTPLDKLGDKRVALIGTGSTGIQIAPALAKDAKEVFVVQRTPSGVDARGNEAIDPEWFKSVATPGWQERWLQAYVDIVTPPLGSPIQPTGEPPEDPIQDGWTEVGKRNRQTMVNIPPEEYNIERVMQALDDEDYVKMEEVRARVDEIVKDPATAAALKPWYRQFCKRPTFHDEFLQCFNLPHVHLVDTNGKGIERFTEKGFVAGSKEYEVDCIIMATGYESPYNALDSQAELELIGESGQTLSEAWADGVRSYQGLFSDGFPNLFIMQILQGAYFAPNLTQGWDHLAKTIAATTAEALRRKAAKLAVKPEAQTAWVEMLLKDGHPAAFDSDCTPGYFNAEGKAPGIREQLAVGYPDGADPFFKFQRDWWESGRFDGLVFDGRL